MVLNGIDKVDSCWCWLLFISFLGSRVWF